MNDFTKSILKVHSPRNHKIKNSYRLKDAYIYYKQHCNNPLSEKEFNYIVRKKNRELIEKFLTYGEVKLPKLGTILLQKFNSFKEDKEGKIKYYSGINWKETLKLWEENEEYRKQKKYIVYTGNKDTYKIIYDSKNSTYHNKRYFRMYILRRVKAELRERYMNNLVDAIR